MSKNSTGSKPHDQTILVVDDNPDNLSVATDCLQGYGFRILAAQDGESALEKARYARPDLILLDVMMPEVDGFETCRRLKADEQLQDIPVIFMTGLVDIRNKAEGFKLGAVDYVTQPFQLEEILARVTTHLRLQEQAKRLQQQATALEQEIAERVRAEEEVRELNAELEQRVEERTAELREANERLRKEIEERKRAEEALRESEEKWRLLYENLPGGSFAVNDQYVIEDVNEFLCTLTGYTREELIGQSCGIICPKGPHQCPVFDLGEERIDNDETAVKAKDGQPVPIIKSARRIPVGGKEVVVENFQDITERVQAEEMYRSLVEHSLQGISIIQGGRMVFANSAYAKMLGYNTAEELLSFSSDEMRAAIHPEDREMTLGRIRARLEGKEVPSRYEVRIVPRDGSVRWFELFSSLIQYQGKPAVQTALMDITESKRAEEALRESEERYRTLFESAGDAIFIHDLSGRILEVNRVSCDRLGYSREELLQMTLMDVDTPEYTALVPERIEELRQHGHLFCETAHVLRDGTIIPIELNSRLIEYGGDQAVLSIARDITERVLAEEAHRSLVEYSLQGLAIFQDGRIVFANSALAEMFGPPLDVLLSLSPDEIRAAIHPEDREMVWGRLRARLEGKAVPPRYEVRIVRLDGSVRWLELFANRVQYQGKPAVQVAFADITERVRAEEELRFQKTLLECQSEASIDGILVVSKDREWLAFNRRFVEMWGIPEAVVESRSGQASLQLATDKLVDPEGFVSKIEHLYEHPDEASRDEIVLKDGRVFDRYSAPVKSPDGVYYGRVWYYRDITSRVRAEEQTKAALEEKEVLLKEIHHRVKNNLQVVSSLLSLQAEQIQDQQIAALFEESQSRIRSMVLIHEQLYQSRALSRIDFAAYLRNLTGYLLRSYGERAHHINFEVCAEDVFLSIDAAIPCGLIVNELVSNALKHAFPDGQQGEVGIELRKDDEGHMTLIIRDNGVGLPEDVDFRDTQTLGLQLVVALTRQLEGSIELDSSDGTTFKLTFSETA